MIKFFFNGSPNPTKIALFFEESGLPYEPIAVDTRKGDQFTADFLAINPNGKVPAILDGEVCVFDSNAILLYLADKTGRFLPANTPQARGELLSWLLFVATGVGPYSGQAVHFKRFAPQGLQYADDRYQYEARRHFAVLDERLSTRNFLVGGVYTIVDMAAWGWARAIPFAMGDDAWNQFPHLKRWFDAISARPAAVRASELKDRFSWKTDWDDAARRVMFPHTVTA